MRRPLALAAGCLVFGPAISVAVADPQPAPATGAQVRAQAAAQPASPGKPPKAPEPPKIEIKPYVPPRIDPEPVTEAADTKTVRVPEDEASVLVRPGPGQPMVGSAVPGARLPVRGMWIAPNARRCNSKRWYILDPFGWVCGDWVKRTEDEPSKVPVLTVPAGKTLPFQYVMVGVKPEESVPLWATLEDMKAEAIPVFQLKKGDTVAIDETAPPLKWKGTSYYVAQDGRVLPVKPTFRMGDGSQWSGLPLDAEAPLPFAWVTTRQAKIYDGPTPSAQVVERAERRSRLPILEESGTGRHRRLRVGDGRWMRADDLNEVRLLTRPTSVVGHEKWIDVDLGEQVLVAYEGNRPVFATLTSSGRAIATPRGNYPIWGKVSTITMKSQPYEDQTYYVDRVPWVLFFQAHNAIHGAYWHDLFGVTKSHGCVNVAPKDARWLFEWVPPALPAQWSGLRTPNLLEGVFVHVRNSSLRRPFEQERNMGPPDREEERTKLQDAEARRLASGAVVGTVGQTEAPGPAQLAAPSPTSGPTPPPAPAPTPSPAPTPPPTPGSPAPPAPTR